MIIITTNDDKDFLSMNTSSTQRFYLLPAPFFLPFPILVFYLLLDTAAKSFYQ